MAEHESIWQAVRASNAAWVSGRAEETAALFHPNAVMIAPAAGARIEGATAILVVAEGAVEARGAAQTATIKAGFETRVAIASASHSARPRRTRPRSPSTCESRATASVSCVRETSTSSS